MHGIECQDVQKTWIFQMVFAVHHVLIYVQRQSHHLWRHWQSKDKVNDIYKIEKYIAIKNNKVSEFDSKWKAIYL